MSGMLNITKGAQFDSSISKVEYHSYAPFLNSFNNSDEIRISVQHQDLSLLICESYIYIEGRLLKADGNPSETAKLSNNAMTYLFESIRYDLNSVEIDHNKNVGHTTTLKNYISLSDMIYNAGWAPDNDISLNK